jgi:cell division transport system ATP-binding protein
MITFQKITKAYGVDDFALQDVSFEIPSGELVFITGASGSGKTTLMRLLTLETTPSSGEITFIDTPLSSISSKTVHIHRRKIGVVFQDYRLLPELNVWENIALPLYVSGKSDSEVEERVTDLLRLVQLTSKAELFPSQLSGGEAQRISIARALATGPEVIFADEPTGNLDTVTAKHIAELLVKINDMGTTVLFATHDHDFLEHFPKHHRLHLEDGALTIDTTNSKKQTKKTQEKTEPKGEPPVMDESEKAAEVEEDLPETEKKPTEAKQKTEKNPQKNTDSPKDAQQQEKEQPLAHSRRRPFWQRLFAKKEKKGEGENKEVRKNEEVGANERVGKNKEVPSKKTSS